MDKSFPISTFRDSGTPPAAKVQHRSRRVPMVIGAGTLLILAGGFALVHRAESRGNKVALTSSPKPVTVVTAKGESYRPVHTYVGTLRPWVEAKVGPQFISAYVQTVLVRPGAVVKKGEILATLDCRFSSAQTSAIASKAKAIAESQLAVSHEATRTQSLLDGGFVSANKA